MGIFIKDPETDKAIRKLAKLRGTTLTAAIRGAVLKDIAAAEPGGEDAQLDKLRRRVKAYPDTGRKADKQFYDGLYEE